MSTPDEAEHRVEVPGGEGELVFHPISWPPVRDLPPCTCATDPGGCCPVGHGPSLRDLNPWFADVEAADRAEFPKRWRW